MEVQVEHTTLSYNQSPLSLPNLERRPRAVEEVEKRGINESFLVE